MEVGGYDSHREVWRVTCVVDGQTLKGVVPEDLVSDEMRAANRPPHEDVYRWLSDHQGDIEQALVAKSQGRSVRAPFHRVMLED